MLELKGLECHPTKTTFIIIGTKRYRKKVEEELKSCPIVFGSFECKPKSQDLYLGDVISAEGLEASVEATIAHRQGKINGEMFEITKTDLFTKGTYSTKRRQEHTTTEQ